MTYKTPSKVSHLARLTPQQVRWARAQHVAGVASKSIAAKLKASKTAISFLLSGKTYTNVK